MAILVCLGLNPSSYGRKQPGRLLTLINVESGPQAVMDTIHQAFFEGSEINFSPLIYVLLMTGMF